MTEQSTKSKIVLARLFAGDMILGELEDPAVGSEVTLKNPRMIAIAPTMAGQMRVALGSVCEPFKVKRLRESITIPKSQIMFQLNEDEIDNELLNGYKSEVTGIKIASAAETASINGSTSKPGNFVL